MKEEVCEVSQGMAQHPLGRHLNLSRKQRAAMKWPCLCVCIGAKAVLQVPNQQVWRRSCRRGTKQAMPGSRCQQVSQRNLGPSVARTGMLCEELGFYHSLCILSQRVKIGLGKTHY
jgi:hypothetical protein